MKRGREEEEDEDEEEEDGKLARLTRWLESHGCSFARDVRIARTDGRGYGVFAKRRLSEDEEFARLPAACVLTAERALASRRR